GIANELGHYSNSTVTGNSANPALLGDLKLQRFCASAGTTMSLPCTQYGDSDPTLFLMRDSPRTANQAEGGTLSARIPSLYCVTLKLISPSDLPICCPTPTC